VSISQAVRRKVRVRANYACEYCGVSEENVGGELTIDHFKPQSQNGSDDLTNLVYCCPRCNLYKGDFWTDEPDAVQLWNPRTQDFNDHFWLSDNGALYALSETGALTIDVLRLNRLPLVRHRQRLYRQSETRRLLEQAEKAMQLLAQLTEQQRTLLAEQQKLLAEQQRLLKLLLDNN